ncbi:MAG: hypothetical protein ACI9JR_001477, partial [Gammaproteobacteria bacterium]
KVSVSPNPKRLRRQATLFTLTVASYMCRLDRHIVLRRTQTLLSGRL